MSKLVVDGLETGVYDSDGHPFRLLKNGVKVFGGTWSACCDQGLLIGEAGDTLTTGTIPKYIDVPIELARQRSKEIYESSGFKTDEFGRNVS